ncbi:unnamed protein product [Polarella glacialis]|uniref:Uncharacterized protein n=1 Tax=Polarella glacialis TaxID=89957 RepID=A0A813H4S6_POLGL|nr:unnamed protein product [Polarella glacialis]
MFRSTVQLSARPLAQHLVSGLQLLLCCEFLGTTSIAITGLQAASSAITGLQSKTWIVGDRPILSGNPVGAAKKSEVSPWCGVGASSGSKPEGCDNVACCCCWDCVVASSERASTRNI